jgi:hypothetical protein
MNWVALLLELLPLATKYGPAILTEFKNDEPQLMAFIAEAKTALANPSNPMAVVPLLIKWGPKVLSTVQTNGDALHQFITEVEAAFKAANTPAPAPSPGAAPAPAGGFTS